MSRLFFQLVILIAASRVTLGQTIQEIQPTTFCESTAVIESLLKHSQVIGCVEINSAADGALVVSSVRKLCEALPSDDTIRTGAAAGWLMRANHTSLDVSALVIAALSSKEKVCKDTLAQSLSLAAYRFQFYVNRIQFRSYRFAYGTFENIKGCRGESGRCLSITVSPWAIVNYGDGETEVSNVKPLILKNLSPGTLTLIFKHPSYKNLRRDIVLSDWNQSVFVDLPEEAATRNVFK